MAPVTSEAQRAELHKTIWRIANDLRGSVDGWDFKSYVLGMLFYRFISENLTSYINRMEREAGEADFDYAKLPDKDAEFGRKETVAEKGFYILPSELFENVRKRAPQDEDLNETLERIFNHIESSAAGTESEDDLKGLFDDLDVNSQKLGATVAKRNEKLVKLLNAIGDLPLGHFEDNSIDVFGDAYEYLMQMYASSAGKSGGEYYTPQEVSELLARITVVGKTQVNKVYDPAVGSGSLLLQFVKVLGKENVRQGFYGQEINLTTYNLARINMFLHDVNYEKFHIAHGDTLIDPQHWDDEPFEAIVSNPPYSINWEGDSNPLLINDPRFAPAGVLAPKSYADLAFTMHMLSWLAVNGTAAIVEFPGVLYRPGAERKIRKYLVDNNYIDAIIQLPADLFFGTNTATCIIVLKKSKKDNAVLFVDATDLVARVGNKNRLLSRHIEVILDSLVRRQSKEGLCALVPQSDIAAESYNLSVSTYVVREEQEEALDIVTLRSELEACLTRQNELRVQLEQLTSPSSQAVLHIDQVLSDKAPGGVVFRSIGDVAACYAGATPSSKNPDFWEDGDIPWMSSGEVNKGIIYDTDKKITKKGFDSCSTKMMPPNTVVIALAGQGKTRGMVARTRIALCTNQSLCSIVTTEDILPDFLYHYLRTQYRKLRKVSAGDGARGGLNLKIIRNFRVPVPPITIQAEIVKLRDRLEEVESELDALLQSELVIRRKLSEIFRERLLTFAENTSGE